MHVKWRAPWNLQFITQVHYEVWLQEKYRAFRAEDAEIIITGDDLKAGEQYSIWVRAGNNKGEDAWAFWLAHCV